MLQNHRQTILALCSFLITTSFILFLHVQLDRVNQRLEDVKNHNLAMYETIDTIAFYNIERANALRGLLAYEDHQFLEGYYSLEHEVKQIKQYARKIDRIPSSLLDLLERDDMWVAQADLVVQVYDRGDIETAKDLAYAMTAQREVLLEDLMTLKTLQLKSTEQEVTALTQEIDELKHSALLTILLYILFNAFTIVHLIKNSYRRTNTDD